MRRFLLFCLTLILLLFAFWMSERRVHLAEAGAPDKYTPAEGPALDLKDMRVLDEMDNEYTRLVQAVVPSVVSITTSRKVDEPGPAVVDPFELLFRGRFFRSTPPRQGTEKSLGSGVIVSKEGYVLTNAHVVQDVDEVQVQLNDGRKVEARIIGSDEDSDIAVLKIDATNLTPLSIGDSDKVKVGQMVFAVGNPFGLQETVTRGIISAKGRNIIPGSESEFFQTDTAINPGNSGGPLVDLRGQVIAINSSIYSGSGGWQGIGFAIPSNVARATLETLLRNGNGSVQPRLASPGQTSGRRTYIGVIIHTLTPEIASQLGMDGAEGVFVMGRTPDGPAEKAGIQQGDIITNFNGHIVKDVDELRSRVAEVPAGKQVKISLLRQTALLSLDITVAEMPDVVQPPPAPSLPAEVDASPPPASPPGPPTAPLAGVHVSEIPPEHRPDLPADVKGVMVDDVDEDTPAAQVLRQADVIEEVNHHPIASVADYESVLKTLKPGDKQMLFICRGKERSFVVIEPR